MRHMMIARIHIGRIMESIAIIVGARVAGNVGIVGRGSVSGIGRTGLVRNDDAGTRIGWPLIDHIKRRRRTEGHRHAAAPGRPTVPTRTPKAAAIPAAARTAERRNHSADSDRCGRYRRAVERRRYAAACIPSDRQARWAEIIKAGGRPDIGLNAQGLYVRKAQGSKTSDNNSHTDTDKPEPAVPSEPAKYRFRLISFQDMRPGLEPIYLVDELIPSAGLVLIWGRQKTFKSFWLLDLILHVAMGWPYRDRDVRQGPVVYCAFEGAHGYKGRIEALRRHYQIADDVAVPLFVMPGQADLIKDHKTLIADLRAQLNGTAPIIVVLDTLNRSLRGSENTEDMARYTEAAETIRAAFNCVVIVVHHCGYDDTHSRGHTSLPAAVDAELEVAREEGSPLLVVAVKHMREGPEGMLVRCRAEVMPLDPDRNGKQRSSIVIVPDDAAGGPMPRSAGRPDNSTPTLTEAMRSALANTGELFHPDKKMPLRAVDQECVRNAFYHRYIDGEADKEKSEDTKRRAFSRGLKRLIADGVVKGQNTDQGRTLLWFANAEVDCP